jgi:mannan endo-1,4-beta-mannosidase
MNEPRCQSDLTCPTIFQSWITEMAAHMKSIGGNNLLEAGLEGFYGLLAPPSRSSVNPPRHDKTGTDFIANNHARCKR